MMPDCKYPRTEVRKPFKRYLRLSKGERGLWSTLLGIHYLLWFFPGAHHSCTMLSGPADAIRYREVSCLMSLPLSLLSSLDCAHRPLGRYRYVALTQREKNSSSPFQHVAKPSTFHRRFTLSYMVTEKLCDSSPSTFPKRECQSLLQGGSPAGKQYFHAHLSPEDMYKEQFKFIP